MAKENYELKENPGYQTVIRSWKNEDPVNAEEIMNPVVETALNNTHAVKLSVDQHKDDSTKHITAAERKKLTEIDEGANKYTHPNSGVTAGTYRSLTVNTAGHVTSGSNPTTISGYGLTDAYTKTEVDTKLNAKANTTSLTDHTGNTAAHITSAERTNWNDANTKKHEHNNKSVLDGITSTKVTNWDSAATNSHTHGNKSVLDGISSTKVSNWDSASTNNHTHSNKTVLDGVTSTKITNWDNASANNHTHSNKTVLDSVSQAKINSWDGYEQKITTINTSLTDSGWKQLTPLSTFKNYESDGGIFIRKIGNLVELKGAVSPKSATNSIGGSDIGANHLVALPSGYAPKVGPSIRVVCQGSGRDLWNLLVGGPNSGFSGFVAANRYREVGSSYKTPGTDAFMVFHVTYTI